MMDAHDALTLILELAETGQHEAPWCWDTAPFWEALNREEDPSAKVEEAFKEARHLLVWLTAQYVCPGCGANLRDLATECSAPDRWNGINRYCNEKGMIINLDGSIQDK
jgi:hypothetical protein